MSSFILDKKWSYLLSITEKPVKTDGIETQEKKIFEIEGASDTASYTIEANIEIGGGLETASKIIIHNLSTADIQTIMKSSGSVIVSNGSLVQKGMMRFCNLTIFYDKQAMSYKFAIGFANVNGVIGNAVELTCHTVLSNIFSYNSTTKTGSSLVSSTDNLPNSPEPYYAINTLGYTLMQICRKYGYTYNPIHNYCPSDYTIFSKPFVETNNLKNEIDQVCPTPRAITSDDKKKEVFMMPVSLLKDICFYSQKKAINEVSFIQNPKQFKTYLINNVNDINDKELPFYYIPTWVDELGIMLEVPLSLSIVINTKTKLTCNNEFYNCFSGEYYTTEIRHSFKFSRTSTSTGRTALKLNVMSVIDAI